MLASKGNLPKKCPILQGTETVFNMLNMDPNWFPYLPEMNFKLDILFSINRIPDNYIIVTTGQIINLRRSAVGK